MPSFNYNFTLALYECETWSLTLRQECRPRVLKRIFRPLRDEVTWKWKRLHNEELYDLYSSPNVMQVIKSNEMGGACDMYGGQKRCKQGFGGGT